MLKRVIPLCLLLITPVLMSSSGYQSREVLEQQMMVAAESFFLPTTPEASAATNVEEVNGLADLPSIPRLRKLENHSLKERLRRVLSTNPHWWKLIQNKKMAVGVVDLSDEDNVQYAGVNGRHMMYAASLPKIAVLAAAHDAIERGFIKETPAVIRDMRLMIAKSDNSATTRMIDRLGFENIARTLTATHPKLYDPAYGGGLWVGKRYAAGGQKYPDPLKGLSHAATAEQVCRFFYMLANNALISQTSSEKMKSYLVDPELHHKFVSVLDRVAPDAKVYRKSGSWRSFHSDVTLVQGPNRNYIMTALIEDRNGEKICRELAEVLDDLLKENSAK